MKKEIRAWLVLLALQIAWIGPCVYHATIYQLEKEEWIESTEDVLRFDIAAEDSELGEITVELVEVETVEQPTLECMGEYRLTAYCSCKKCCKQWAENRPLDEFGNEIVYGASGAVLEAGKSIAVDPDVIPYGTTVIINGHEYIAQDCGGSIKGSCIDIYFDSHEEACNFGIQYAEVFICH